MLAAGLAGKSSHMMCASVGCMAKVLHEYKDNHGISDEFAGQLLGAGT